MSRRTIRLDTPSRRRDASRNRGALLEPLTKDVFQRAGLSPGMRVLDVGCGIGDVSLLAVSIVGAQGTVLGIDRASSSVEAAGRRCCQQFFQWYTPSVVTQASR